MRVSSACGLASFVDNTPDMGVLPSQLSAPDSEGGPSVDASPARSQHLAQPFAAKRRLGMSRLVERTLNCD